MAFYLALFFILGSAVGSFLNVVVDRVVKGGNILGRSRCDYCRTVLSVLDLVPVVSFITLGGRCRYCRRKLALQYPLVESLCGFLFSLTFYMLVLQAYFSLLLLAYYLFIISVLIVVAIVDLRFSLIPTSFVFASSLVSLFYNYFYLDSGDFVRSVFSAFALALSFLGIVALTRGKGMGSGDIPLVFLLGLFLGWPKSLAAIFLAFLSGAAISIILLASRKKTLGQAIPFGPFLIASAVAVLFWGNALINWYLEFF